MEDEELVEIEQKIKGPMSKNEIELYKEEVLKLTDIVKQLEKSFYHEPFEKRNYEIMKIIKKKYKDVLQVSKDNKLDNICSEVINCLNSNYEKLEEIYESRLKVTYTSHYICNKRSKVGNILFGEMPILTSTSILTGVQTIKHLVYGQDVKILLPAFTISFGATIGIMLHKRKGDRKSVKELNEIIECDSDIQQGYENFCNKWSKVKKL